MGMIGCALLGVVLGIRYLDRLHREWRAETYWPVRE